MLSRTETTIWEFVAVKDTFGESATLAELIKKCGIDCDAVQAAVRIILKINLFSRKKVLYLYPLIIILLRFICY